MRLHEVVRTIDEAIEVLRSWGAVRIGWHMRDADSVVLAARGSRSVVGFAIMRYADESAHLNLLAVAPEYRRQGIARALLTWLEGTALRM